MAPKKTTVKDPDSWLPSELADLGVSIDTPDSKPRAITGVWGGSKSGRTTFATSAPGPIFYLGIDLGHKGVVDRHIKEGKKIALSIHKFLPDRATRENEAKMAAFAAEYLEKIRYTYETAARSGIFRSFVWDTATEVWEIIRASRPEQKWAVLTSEYRELVRMSESLEFNLVMIDKDSDIWKKTSAGKSYKEAGVKQRNGHDDQVFLCTHMLRTHYDMGAKEFQVIVEEARFAREHQGDIITIDDPSIGFAQVMAVVMPEVDAEAWSD